MSIADPDPERRALAQAEHPSVRLVRGLDDLLTMDLDGVIIASPARLHVEHCDKALRAGMNALVEKPFAMDVGGAERIGALAAEEKLTVMAGHTFLYSPPVRYVRDRIIDGDLGDLLYLHSRRVSLGRIRSDCSAIWNFAPHDASILLYWLEEMPVEVSAVGRSFLQPGVEDLCFAVLNFPSGVAAQIHVGWLEPKKTRLTTLVGTEKMLVYDDVSVDAKVQIFDSGAARADGKGLGEHTSMGDFQWRTRSGDVHIPKIDMSAEPLQLELEEFAAAITTGRSPLTDSAHAVNVTRILSAIEDSAKRRGAPVQI